MAPRVRKLQILISLWVAVGLGSAAPVEAAFILRVEDEDVGGTGVVISDNSPGDLNPLVGAIVFSGALSGGFMVNVTTGISKPLIGGAVNLAELDLNSVNVQSVGPGTLRITLEDTGYTGGADGSLLLMALLGGTLTAPAGSTISVQSWVNPGDLVPALGPVTFPPAPLAPIGPIPPGSVPAFGALPITFGPGAFAATGFARFTKSGPYSLFAQATVAFTGPGIVSFDEDQQVVPLPASLALLVAGLGLLGLRLAVVRRKERFPRLARRGCTSRRVRH